MLQYTRPVIHVVASFYVTEYLTGALWPRVCNQKTKKKLYRLSDVGGCTSYVAQESLHYEELRDVLGVESGLVMKYAWMVWDIQNFIWRYVRGKPLAIAIYGRWKECGLTNVFHLPVMGGVFAVVLSLVLVVASEVLYLNVIRL